MAHAEATSYELGEVESILTPAGDEYAFGDGGAKAVLDVGGRGLPAVEYQTLRGYQQQSETVVGWLLQPRQVTVTVAWDIEDRADYWAARRELRAFLRMNLGGPLTLMHYRADGTTRAIRVYPDTPAIFESEAQWASPQTPLPFVAYDPVFYDPTAVTLTMTKGLLSHLLFDSAAGGILFDSAVGGILFGDEVQVGLQSIAYEGDWAAYPTITINGPYDWVQITNQTTGKAIKLGQPVPSGGQRVITLTPGAQTIVDETGASRFDELVLPPSDLVGFNIRPRGTPYHDSPYEGVAGGINVIQATAGGAVVGSTAVTLVYYPRYLGIA